MTDEVVNGLKTCLTDFKARFKPTPTVSPALAGAKA
jgi:hypothetical protein